MKKALTIGLTALSGVALLGAGIGLGFAIDQPATVVEIVEVPLMVTEQVEVPVEVIKEITVEKIVEVEDVALLEKVCDKLMYDDISECREEVVAEDAALKLALALLDDEDEVFDLLEDEEIIKDEDEASIIKVYDDFEDIVIKESDFDDEEYKFVVTMKVEDEDKDVKKKVDFTIKVEDGEADIVKVVEQ